MIAHSPFDDFTARRRAVIILILGGLWTVGSFSTDLFLPAMPKAAEALGASESAVALSVTTFLIGLGLGQLIAGPVSDGRGRRPTLLAGLVVFSASAVVCLFAPSVEVLVAVRFVQGAAAAFGLAIPNAMVTDYARDRQAARLFSWIVIIGGVAPLVASLTGAQMLRLLGWRGPFVALTAIGVFALVCVAVWLPESLPRERRSTGGLRTALRTMAALTRDAPLHGVHAHGRLRLHGLLRLSGRLLVRLPARSTASRRRPTASSSPSTHWGCWRRARRTTACWRASPLDACLAVGLTA